ncbi:transmembrane protein, putative [Medicago truncatula]|nr:transmembrane protein, putative [Medicago truncatula]AES88210.1 transmembrane protein, putative [Medicago truncatula]
MASFKSIMLNLAFLFMILLSMKVAATARVPLWKIKPHHHKEAYERLLNSVSVNDRPRFHNYGVPPPPAPIS